MLVKTSNAQTEETFKEPKYDSKRGGGRRKATLVRGFGNLRRKGKKL